MDSAPTLVDVYDDVIAALAINGVFKEPHRRRVADITLDVAVNDPLLNPMGHLDKRAMSIAIIAKYFDMLKTEKKKS